VQLQALPKDGTTPEAVATAKSDATASGAADVGALDSDEYPSLDGGRYAIYSTVSMSKADAESVLAAFRSSGGGRRGRHVPELRRALPARRGVRLAVRPPAHALSGRGSPRAPTR
jgi:hypothetical protein